MLDIANAEFPTIVHRLSLSSMFATDSNNRRLWLPAAALLEIDSLQKAANEALEKSKRVLGQDRGSIH